MKRTHTYLNFDGDTEEAFDFYRSVFGGEFAGLFRFRDFGGEAMGLSGADLDKIMHIALPIGDGDMLMGTDMLPSLGQSLRLGNNSYIYIDTEAPEEARRLFDGLSAGGKVEMDLQKVEWAELYGSFADRYGVQWMVNFTGSAELTGPA